MAGDNLYYMGNHALPTNDLPAKVTIPTATAVVLLQLSAPSSRQFTLVEWGISFDGSPAAVQVQLRASSATTATAASMTAGIIEPFTNPDAPASLSTSGTANSCFYTGPTGAAAPTATVSAFFDTQTLSTNTYVKQWPLNREPGLNHGLFLQLCIKMAAAVASSAYFIWREQ